MPSRLRAVLVILLTAALLAYFLYGVKFGRVWEAVRHAEARLLVVGVLVTMLTYVLRAVRWQYLLAPLGPTRFSTAFPPTVIGFAAGFFVPPRPEKGLCPHLLS